MNVVRATRAVAGVAAVVVALLPAATPAAASPTGRGPATGGAPASVQVTPGGRYAVDFADPRYHFGGEVGSPVRDIRRTTGTDQVGGYTEVTFTYHVDTTRRASIRAYRTKPVVLFSVGYPDGGANTAAFPTLSEHPRLPYQQTYHGCFALGQFNTSEGAVDSPWLFFDGSANAFLLSPASHFPVARTWRDGGAIASGIDPAIATVPAGTVQRTLLVAGSGINKTYQTWGHALTDLNGKRRPANDADVTLDKLGYWTDNGATYYYNYQQDLGYAGTLQALKRDWDAQGIPMGYLQLDSWFYPKGPDARWEDLSGGQYRYEAAADLFPDGLAGFRSSIGGIPLVTHARWIDPASPYHSEYATSGNVVTSRAYWYDRAAYLAAGGVTTYEQDWLCAQAQPAYNLTDRDDYLDNMAAATAAYGMTMQYCMPYPRDVLQGSMYSNLTTVRVSNDRFERGKWDEALYASQLTAGIGAWPWVDVFSSSETRNLLLATLTAGPVGVGDAIGALNKDNLMRAARPDGVIVKPDAPITPTDATYIGDAAGQQPAMVAATHTDHDGLRHAYVYAYARAVPLPTPDTVYQAEDATLSGPVIATDHSGYTGTGFADYLNPDGDYLQWTVQAPADGTYTLLFRYANAGTADRPLEVTVNGSSVGTQPFPPTGSWDYWLDQAVVVTLHAGANTVRATATGASGPNIDYLGVSAGVVTPPTTQPASFRPASLGISGDAYVYDYFAGTGTVVPAGQTFHTQVDRDGSYYVVAPINRAGIAFLGDAGKFVSVGAKRVTRLSDNGATVRASVAFAPGETALVMRGYAPHPVRVHALSGQVDGVSYDSATHMFSFRVRPGHAAEATFVLAGH
jgi:hypothetical protein